MQTTNDVMVQTLTELFEPQWLPASEADQISAVRVSEMAEDSPVAFVDDGESIGSLFMSDRDYDALRHVLCGVVRQQIVRFEREVDALTAGRVAEVVAILGCTHILTDTGEGGENEGVNDRSEDPTPRSSWTNTSTSTNYETVDNDTDGGDTSDVASDVAGDTRSEGDGPGGPGGFAANGRDG